MSTLATLVVKLVGDISDYTAKMDESARLSQRIGQDMRDVGSTLTKGVTLPIVGIGTAATIAATQFNRGMADIASLSQEAADQIGAWKPQIQDVAVAMGKGTGDMTDGMYQIVSAYGAGDEAVQQLALNAKLAAAGLSTTSEAIALTSAVTKGYGDSSLAAQQKAADLAMQTVSMGQTTFPELAASMGRVTPIAAALGVSQEELYATMATASGVTGQTAEVSTQLRGVLQSMMAPTADMSKLTSDLGFASAEAMLDQLGLQGAIETVVEAATATGTPLQKYIGSIEGQTLALALAGPQADAFREKLAAMGDASGTLDRAFAAQTEGVNALGFTMEQTKIKAQVLLERLGDGLAPALSRIMDIVAPLITKLTAMAQRFAEMDPRLQTIIVAVLGAVAALGPLLMIIGTLIPAISAIASVVGVAGAALGALLSPVGLVVAAIAAVIAIVAALVVAWNRDWGGIRTKTQEVLDYIGPKIQMVIDFIKATIGEGLALIRGWWQEHGDSVMSIVNTVWGAIQTVVTTVINVIKSIIQIELEAIRAFWAAHGETITTVARNTWEMIKTIISSVLDIIGGIVDAFAALLRGDWEGLGRALQDIWQACWNIIKTIMGTARDNLTAVANDILSSIINAFSGLASGVADKFNAMKQHAVDAINNLKSAIISALTGIGDEAYARGAALGQRLADGIRSAIGTVTDAASALAAKVREFLPGSDAKTGPLRDIFASGRALAVTLGRGILSSTGATAAVETMTEQIRRMLSMSGLEAVFDVSGAGRRAYAGGGATASRNGRQGDNEQGGNTYNVTIYNPVGVPAEVDLVRQLRNMAAVGLI